MITRKEAEKIAKEFGIGVAPKDDPIYNEAPSIRFINRSTKSKVVSKKDKNSSKKLER